MTAVTLEVRDVSVAFAGRPVLAHVDLTAAGGEVLALLGPSGSGKSTLLRVIAGLLSPDAGHVLLDGRDITTLPTHRRGIGMVFQDEQLFPHRDVHANIAFGLRMQRRDRSEIDRRVAEMLELVGLAGFDRRAVTELSGGEAKRVALARSLAPAPHLVLLDEPLTGLDRDLHDHLAGEVGRILRATATTAILVTHDPQEATVVADRVVRLGDLGGRRPNVVDLDAASTHPLRRAVLREGRADASVVFDGDDEPGTLHLGLQDSSGTLLGVSTWLWRPCPQQPGDHDRQLRGMAVDTTRQAGGLGAVLLATGVERALADGATTVWANARDTALGFYARHGFEVLEPGHVDPATGLPHHHIRLAEVAGRLSHPGRSRHPWRVRHLVPTTSPEGPMPTDPTAADHRRRADELRRYANHLDATPLDEMLRWAGPDTWVSPLADELVLELRRDRARLGDAADDVRRHAHWLDAQAAALDER